MQRIVPSYLSPVQYSLLSVMAFFTLLRLKELLILASLFFPQARQLLNKLFPLHVSLLGW